MAAPSYDDLYNTGKAEMLLKRPDLFLNEGDISDFIVAMAAAMADKNSHHIAEGILATFLDTAVGDDLTTLVNDHWGLERQNAVAATVTLSFTRTLGGLPAGNIPAGFTVATAEDANGERQEFTTDAILSWALAESGTKTIGATASVAGRDGNVGAAEITVFVDSPFDSNFSVTNASAAAGGTEAETDDALRERARAFPSTLRRGTAEALAYGAKSVAGVAVATVVEDDDTGLVTIYIADSSGGSSSQLEAAVELEIEDWRAAGTVVEIVGGTVLTQAITLSITAKAGTDTAALVSDIEDAIEARLDKLEIGETLYRSMIRTTVMNVRIDKILEVSVTVPATDVQPSANQVIRAGVITVS